MGELNPIPTPAYTSTSTHNMDTFTPRAHLHNDPTGINGTPVPSTIGPQQTNAYMLRKILREVARKRKFLALSETTYMPPNMGKRIRASILLPLLDDRNLNDQGIDAKGAQIRNGNLYGSSTDIGKISAMLPVVSETGGRVNRVGFGRRNIEGSFIKMGFFYEWTREFENFDSDPQVLQHMYEEAIIAAHQIQEDALQIDLMNGAGTIIYAGSAVSDATCDHTSQVSYKTFVRLEQALTAVRTPKQTKLLTGSTLVDTRTVIAERVAFVPSELKQLLFGLMNSRNEPALVPVEKYGSQIKPMEDEIGIINGFRLIEVQDMKCWRGVGAVEDPSKNLWATNGKYDVFPILSVGAESFSTISFIPSGKQNGGHNFEIITKKPSAETASSDDPYGEVGFTSIKWYYGILFLRPERIGLIKTTAPY